ncbi:MAG: AAA family ATPase [Bacteroidetes bacterium]|nr:AAA family ATPase [Bacteroidota bacterium]
MMKKEAILDIITLCNEMVSGKSNGTLTAKTYTELFRPSLDKFEQQYALSPNLYLQKVLKEIFTKQNLSQKSSNLNVKNFGFWGRSIYNYTWTCIFYNFNQGEIPASYSPQLYILVNKEGIKFGFCYGHHVQNSSSLVRKATESSSIQLLAKSLKDDPNLYFLNTTKDEITARPEKLFGVEERIEVNSNDALVNNWSNNSLLIKEFKSGEIPENIEEIINSTITNLLPFFLSILPVDYDQKKLAESKALVIKDFNTEEIARDFDTSNFFLNKIYIEKFASSLLTKPFVILTGLSGSGKTKLAQAFAKWICENDSQYCIVPVGADWTNREPLLGFPNALDKNEYVKPDNRALDLILLADKDQSNPYFLILDEMNLSHVERYFADFLSVMESKESISLHSGDAETTKVPNQIKFPNNLFIIGTVNIDETTYMFSPKVLDRANVIEFRITKTEMGEYLSKSSELNMEELNGKGAGAAGSFLELARDKSIMPSDSVNINSALLSFFTELKKSGAEFGYRSASEIMRFAAVINKLEISWDTNAIIDAAIMQKLLPKVHGSQRKLDGVLKALGKLCLADDQKIEDYLINGNEINFEDREKIKYPISFEKIIRMYHNLQSNGFTSYAEA